MKDLRKVLCLSLALMMLISMFASCGGSGESKDGDESKTQSTAESTAADDSGNNVSEEKGDYQISLKTFGGLALSDVDFYIYTDDSLSDMESYGKTDENGNASVELTKGIDYAITFAGVPKGYELEESYSFTGNTANIVLSSAPVSGENLADTVLGVGDVMYDFSVTSADGDTVTLSEVLKEKELVVLNFWYTTCSWCLTEFPIMNEVYQTYSEDVEIIALNPLDGVAAVKNFDAEYGYSFVMADCPASWANTFSVTGYPTSVFVDRYGVICLIEAGAITSLRPFVGAFEHFTADNYEQKLFTGVSELVTNVAPTYEMDSSEAIGALINSGDIEVTYRAEEGNDAEFTWPFIEGEKNGDKCIYASNRGIEGSFATIYADITLKAGQAIGFDYFVSSESLADILYVIVNNEDIYQISGTSQQEWKSCYPWIAETDGVYELALCYLKDDDTNEGDDTVYIKNVRVVEADEIDTETFIPRYASTETEDGYNYVEIFFNEKDGYYHVGSEDGPLLLAELMNITMFNEETTVYEMAYDGNIVLDGHNYYDDLLEYFSYASNSTLNGVCTVNYELAELLKVVAEVAGFDGTENEWLKICKYYQVYGSDGAQLEDPIKGLATFSAYDVTMGVGVDSNYFYYDRAIIPRGLLAKFTPSVSGVYRFTSHNDSQDGVEAWILNDNKEIIYTYEHGERMFNEDGECSIVYYMEAGTNYYIDIAFWDVYQVGYIYYDVEYIGSSHSLFRSASPGYFTYDSDATGDEMYYVISGGIDAVLGNDGYYYHDLGLDANGNQIYGSLIYADFTGVTSVFDTPISNVYAYDENGNVVKDENGNPVEIKGMIEKGAFDFSKTEEDLYILGFMAMNDNDADATDEYLKEYWGDSYEEYAESYQIDDVFAGRYHGTGEDMSDEISAYLSKIITGGSNSERNGCVPVDEELAELLQKLMDKYTFENVDFSWLKLCYYYDHLG